MPRNKKNKNKQGNKAEEGAKQEENGATKPENTEMENEDEDTKDT